MFKTEIGHFVFNLGLKIWTGRAHGGGVGHGDADCLVVCDVNISNQTERVNINVQLGVDDGFEKLDYAFFCWHRVVNRTQIARISRINQDILNPGKSW